MEKAIDEATELRLVRDWDAPTHFFPKGMAASVSFFSNMSRMRVEEFIKKYEESQFIGWFETVK